MAKNSSINQMKYDKEKIVRVSLKLHKENDKDILNAIGEKNKQGSIKILIRKGIEKAD